MPTKPPTHKPAGRPATRRHQPRVRTAASQLTTTWRWRKARAAYLSEHPLCVACEREGRTEPATVVDHITPHKGDMALAWDVGNWQALCKPCHDRKTATSDGGYGHGGGG